MKIRKYLAFVFLITVVFLSIVQIGFCQKQKKTKLNVDFTIGLIYFFDSHKNLEPLAPFTPSSFYFEKCKSYPGLQAGISSLFTFKSKVVIMSALNFQYNQSVCTNDSFRFSQLFPSVDRFMIESKARRYDLQFYNGIGYKLGHLNMLIGFKYDLFTRQGSKRTYNNQEHYPFDFYGKNIEKLKTYILFIYDFESRYRNTKIGLGLNDFLSYPLGLSFNVNINLYSNAK